jgi:hypothetical protein
MPTADNPAAPEKDVTIADSAGRTFQSGRPVENGHLENHRTAKFSPHPLDSEKVVGAILGLAELTIATNVTRKHDGGRAGAELGLLV